MCIYNAFHMQQTNKWKQNKIWWNALWAGGKKDDGGDGRRKIIWRKFRCKHTKEFQSESLQKLFTKSASKPERVGMCLSVYFRVCVCVCLRVYWVFVRVYLRRKKCVLLEDISSLARWHGRRRRKQGRTAVIISIVVIVVVVTVSSIVVVIATFFFADSPDCSHAGQSDPQGQPRARSFGIETINKSKVRLRRVFSMLAQEQEKNTTTMTTATAMALWQCCQCLRSHALCSALPPPASLCLLLYFCLCWVS